MSEDVADNPGGWNSTDREAFWRLVRGRMAERGLRHQQVADAIGVDRSNLTRRLRGLTRERPSEWTVEQLANLLQLDRTSARQLYTLAGYGSDGALPVDPPDSLSIGAPVMAAPAAADVAAPEIWTRRHMLRNASALAIGLVLLGAVARALFVGLIRPRGPATHAQVPARAAASVQPGGVWVRPADGETVAGAVHFAARAYRTNPADPPIAFVNFTVSWEGRAGPWLIACRVERPVEADLYVCDWDPGSAGAPGGQLRVSFDVYDRAGRPNYNLSPNGTRTLQYVPAISAVFSSAGSC